jgi:hypothetical protein
VQEQTELRHRLKAAGFSPIRPIETRYRGHRFRSRLEARWAVFFDAAGIEWRYEAEGFDVNGRRYLPDFWLPKLESFVEIKPDEESAKAAEPLLRELVCATGHRAILIAGIPFVDAPPKIIRIEPSAGDSGETFVFNDHWRQCSLCNRVKLNYSNKCCSDSFPGIEVLWKEGLLPDERGPRVEHAMRQAQGARFEHGENGRPKPYVSATLATTEPVYVAGAVLDEGPCEYGENVLPWRAEIFGLHKFDSDEGEVRAGRFKYAGPTIAYSHGDATEGLASRCIAEVEASRVMFVWVDRPDTVGTIAEIGAAYALRIPIFVAFMNDGLRRQFYFACQLATAAVIAPNAVSAWQCFVTWRNR